MTADRPTVSVVVPTYYRSHLLVKAVQSVLAQSYQNLGVIVVDNGSNDATAELIASYRDSRLLDVFETDARKVAQAHVTRAYSRLVDITSVFSMMTISG
jgi:glycosyltransferase involved in cell wall biosynthesis